MKKLCKPLILILFIAFTVVILHFARRLFMPKTNHGILQASAMYDQPHNSIDVVFMGSSHIYYNINTALLWEKYGMAAYDYGTAEQPLWITYHYLKELCKYQDPKLVVIDLYCPARFKDDHQYVYLRDSLQGMRFSPNKLIMFYESCAPDKYEEYFPDFADYHQRYDKLTQEDWDYLFSSKEERASFKGFTPYTNVDPQEEPELTMRLSGGITIKSEIYLQKIIDFTAENDIKLFLIVCPYITTDDDELVYNRIHEIADNYSIPFNSTNYFYSSMDLDFETDFNDPSHLNYDGSCKFTDYLGKEIKDNFDIPDRRGQAGYESWDKHVEEIKEAVAD